MAQIHGKNRTWGAISARLETLHLQVDRPGDIETLLARSEAEYEKSLALAHKVLEDEIINLESTISQEKIIATSLLGEITDKWSLEMEQAEANLDLYRQDRSLSNLLRNKLRIRRETRKIDQLSETLKKDREAVELPVTSKEIELVNKKNQLEEHARQACQDLFDQIQYLKSISGTHDLALAAVEFDMAEQLRLLPEDSQVINNFHLQLEKGILFEGKWLFSARIDHLVVTPAGLFAIEDKNWSKQPGENEAGADLYEQIRQAAHLCYTLIKSEFPAITLRSILAYRGHPPAYSNSGIVKVLPINEVLAYINWFADETLSNQAIQQIILLMQKISLA